MDATVVLRNKATNGQATQKTNSAGQYTFLNVAPGEYEVTVKRMASGQRMWRRLRLTCRGVTTWT